MATAGRSRISHAEADGDRAAPAGWRRGLTRFMRHEELALLLLLGVIIAYFVIVEPVARQSDVYFDLLREVSPYLVCGVGMTLLLLAGELDLTVGSMLAVTGVVTIDVANRTGGLWLGAFAGLMTGPLVGMINGYLVTKQKMDSLMTTLGMMFALRGLVYVYTNRTPVVDEHAFANFTRFWSVDIGPVPLPGLVALVPIVLAYILLTRTEFGRSIYAIGGNAQAARVSGIDVQRVKFTLFVVSGSLAALAGLMVASQTGTGYFDAGVQGFELIVIASVVLGGVSLSGGDGRLVSAMLGVVILGMTGKGLRLLNVDTTQQLVVTGVMMLIAVWYHRLRKGFVRSGVRDRR